MNRINTHKINTRIFAVLFCLTCFASSFKAQSPVDYTLQQADLTIENGIITACSYNFNANTNGTNLTIPEELGVTGIIDAKVDWMGNIESGDPFIDKNIRSISFPTTLINIGDYSFSKNELTKLTLPNGIETIGRDAFAFNNIGSISIPSSVKSIGVNCFYNNTDLETVTFADNSYLIYIGSHAFVNTKIYTIKLPTPIVPDNNFEYWIKGDYNNSTYKGGESVSPGNSSFTAKFFHTLSSDDLTIENGIITSCSYDFSSKFITIPSEVDGSEIKGIADGSSQKNAIFYGKSILELKLPSTLETIGNFAFNSNSIDTLKIPSSVKSIGQYAFWGFELDTVIFEDNCNITKIGYGAFDNNYNLKMAFPTPIKEGYVFDKWEDDDDPNNTYVGGNEIIDFQTSYTAYFTLATSIFSYNIKNEEIKVFPNPVKSNLNIICSNNYNIELIDINGNKLIDRNIDSNDEIDMSNMKKGTYILRFINDSDVITKKITKK